MKFLRNNAMVLGLVPLLFGLDHFLQAHLISYHYKVLVDVGIAIILAVSLNLINGITGQFSLGHAGFMCVGAYVASAFSVFFSVPHFGPAGLSAHLMIGIAVILGGLAAAAAGLIIGIPTLRLRGDYLAIATLGFGEIIRIVVQNMEKVGGPRGIFGMPTLSNFFWVSIWCVICILVVGRLCHSIKGKAFYAIREDEFAATTIGIDVTRYKVIAFLLGSFFAGVGGALFAHSSTGYINPNQFSLLKSVELVVMVVLGGLGSISGSIIAAIVLTLLPELLRDASTYRMVSYAFLLIIMMLTRPQGLFGSKEIYQLKWFAKKSSPPVSDHGQTA